MDGFVKYNMALVDNSRDLADSKSRAVYVKFLGSQSVVASSLSEALIQ
jgi:hypothetical protein